VGLGPVNGRFIDGDCSVEDKGVFGVFDVTNGVLLVEEPGRRALTVRRSVVDEDDID
jgi:hypothetical protein